MRKGPKNYEKAHEMSSSVCKNKEKTKDSSEIWVQDKILEGVAANATSGII